MNRWLMVSVVLALAAAAASVYVLYVVPDRLPAEVPIHWNARGEANDWVARDRVWPHVWAMPLVMAGFVGLTLILPWLSPRSFDVDRFRPTYNYLMMLAIALLGYVHLCLLLAMTGTAQDVGRFLMGGTFLFFALLGNVLGKVQRNFWMGVRTPWTLASEPVWTQTHRMAAWLWVAGGLVGLLAVLVGLPVLVAVPLLLVLAFTPVVYSLVLYKRLERQGKLSPAAGPPQEGAEPG